MSSLMRQLSVFLMGSVFVLAFEACHDEEILSDNSSFDSANSSLTKGNGGVVGDVDYCNDGPNTCGVGEGDCDSDEQCQGELLCAQNVGHLIGLPSSVDFCRAVHCANGVKDGDEDGVDCGGSCAIACCHGDGTFDEFSIANLSEYADPGQIAAGDLNADHIPDLVTANRSRVNGQYAISVLIGNGVSGRGDGTYQAPQPFVVGELPVAVKIVDLDKDGAADILAANENSYSISILWSHGGTALQFTRQDLSLAAVGPEAYPSQFDVADIDNDGDLDIVCTNWSDNSIGVFLGGEPRSFGTPRRYPVGSSVHPSSIATGDFNSDNLIDLAICNSYGDKVSVLMASNNGGFNYQEPLFLDGPTLQSDIVAQDFNTDNILDLAVVDMSDTKIHVYDGYGDGTFAAARTFQLDYSANAIAVSDLNSDGIKDMALTGWISGLVMICLGQGNNGQGDGTFVAGQVMRFDPATTDVVILDVKDDGVMDATGDGAADLAVCNYGTDDVVILAGNTVCSCDTACDDGNGCTIDKCVSGVCRYQTVGDGLACSDSDMCTSDGRCLSGTCVGTHTVCDDLNACTHDSCDIDTGCVNTIILCDDNNACTQDSCDVHQGCVNTSVSCDDSDSCTYDACDEIVGCFHQTIKCDDFNMCTIDNCDSSLGCQYQSINCDDGNNCTDDFCDARAGCQHSPNERPCDDNLYCTVNDVCYLGTCSGTLRDCDDFRECTKDSCDEQNQECVSEFIHNPNGQFVWQSETPVGSSPMHLIVRDINQRGVPDLITANFGDDSISVVLGEQGGFLSGQVTTYAQTNGDNPFGIDAADLDLDGAVDVVVANAGSNSVAIHWGSVNNAGNFENLSYLSLDSVSPDASPAQVAVADFDADTIMDLAVCNWSDDSVVLWRGMGNRSFSPPVRFALDEGSRPRAMLAGNLNSDSNIDLAIAFHVSNQVVILPGDGQGGFGVAQQILVGPAQTSLASADLDSNGREDLVVTTSQDNKLHVILANTDGILGIPVAYPTGSTPISIEIADLNNDNKLDLLVGEWANNSIRLFAGDGTGNINFWKTLSTDEMPYGAVALDISEDGVVDVVSISYLHDKINFLVADNSCKGVHCDDGIRDGDEQAVDCGGSCSLCPACEANQPCCDPQILQFLNQGTVCASREEFRCTGTECGADAEHRIVTRHCSGDSGVCPDDSVEQNWTAVGCNSNQLCQTDLTTYANCISCEHGCGDASCYPECNPFEGACCGMDGRTFSGCYHDFESGLDWEDPPNQDSMDFQDAKDHCSSLGLGGHSDWRLPTISQLRTLIRGCEDSATGGACQIDDVCSSSLCRVQEDCNGCPDAGGPGNLGFYWPAEIGLTNCSAYWSATSLFDDPSQVWLINYNTAEIYPFLKDFAIHARCVR